MIKKEFKYYFNIQFKMSLENQNQEPVVIPDTYIICVKLVYTNITTTLNVLPRLHTIDMINEINKNPENNTYRQQLNIHPKYYIELVEAGQELKELAPAMEPHSDEKLSERFGCREFITLYARPSDIHTGEFIRNAAPIDGWE